MTVYPAYNPNLPSEPNPDTEGGKCFDCPEVMYCCLTCEDLPAEGVQAEK